jgi:hypothetical protein
MTIFDIDRQALKFAQRVTDRQVRNDETIAQLPVVAPALVDLVPFFHIANGQTSMATLGAVGPFLIGSTGLAPTTGTPKVQLGQYTAVGASTAIGLATPFTTWLIPVVYDLTAGQFVTSGFTLVTAAGFTFPSTSAHVYNVAIIGL